MTWNNSLQNLTAVGLDVLVDGLRPRFLPHRLQEQRRHDRVPLLRAAEQQIVEYHGAQSPAYQWIQWCLQLHCLLQSRVQQDDTTEEMAIGDLERMQDLAEFLEALDTSSDIRTLRDQIPFHKPEATLFQSASGGFAQLADLLQAAATAFQERLTRLTGTEFGSIPHSLDEQMRLLADQDFLTAYLIDGSHDDRERCMILARMIGVIDSMHRMEVPASVHAMSADAQRIQQLAVAVGVSLQARTGTFASVQQSEPALAVPAESETTASTSGPDDSRNLVLSIEVPDREIKSVPDPAPPLEPPSPPPDATVGDASEEGPPQEDSGVGRLLIGLVAVVLTLGLLALFTVGNFTPNGDFNVIESLQRWLVGVDQPAREPEAPVLAAAIPVPTAESTPEPTATLAPTPTLTPEPTFTPTPTPTPVSIPDDVAYATDAASKFKWPHRAAVTVGDLEAWTAVTLVRRVQMPESGDVWLQLLDGAFVESRYIENIPDSLPWMDLDAMGMPDFDANAVEPAVEKPEPAALPDIVLRTGPGVQYEEKGRLSADTPLEPIGVNAQGDWVVLATRYWVSNARIPNLPDGLPVTTAPYVSAQVANVRQGPSQDTELVQTLVEGQTIVLVAQTAGSNPPGPWYRLDGGSWIWGELVEDVPADLPQE